MVKALHLCLKSLRAMHNSLSTQEASQMRLLCYDVGEGCLQAKQVKSNAWPVALCMLDSNLRSKQVKVGDI